MAMKNMCVIVLLAVSVSLAVAQDVSILLKNQELVTKEIGCVLGRNRCDVIGKQIKRLLPDALHNGCRSCTPQQAQNARKLISFMKKSHPQEWRQIVQMYSKPKRAAVL